MCAQQSHPVLVMALQCEETAGSSKLNRVWQSSHSGAAPFCVVQDLLWGILYQNRQMDGRYSAVLAWPFFLCGWDATVQKSSVGTMDKSACASMLIFSCISV